MKQLVNVSSMPWLPAIDSSWDVVRADHFLSVKKTVVGEKWPDYTLLSLTKAGVVIRDFTDRQGKLPETFDSYQEVQIGDLVMCLFDMDETPRTVGISSHRGMITGAYTTFQFDQTIVVPSYFEYLFISIDDRKAFKAAYSGLRKTIRPPVFLSLRFPLPPLETQQRIADYLDRETAEIDAAVADLDRYVELLESRKIEKLKELIFADNEGEFPLIPVQLLFRKISSGSTPKGEHFYAESGNGVPWVTTSELREKIITETKKNVTPQAVEKVSGLVVFPRDTILIAMYGATIGRFGRLGVNATSNQACCALIDPIGIDPEFFYYSLYVHSGELVKQAFGGGQPNINQDTIRRFRAPVPSLAKQRKIAREMKILVDETENIIADSTKLRDLLLKRRSVLITEVVTGRKQV